MSPLNNERFGLAAARPLTATLRDKGTIWTSTDTNEVWTSDGVDWILLGGPGSGGAEVTFDLFANRPAANTVAPGTIFVATDTGNTYVSDGATWFLVTGDVVAGAGLTKSGNTLNVGAGLGITVAPNTVDIDTTVVPQLDASNLFTNTNLFAGVRYDVETKVGPGTYVADLATDMVYLVNTTGGATTVELPEDHLIGATFIIKDKNGTALVNNITVTTADFDTIDGAADYTISTNYGFVQVVSDGNNWFII